MQLPKGPVSYLTTEYRTEWAENNYVNASQLSGGQTFGYRWPLTWLIIESPAYLHIGNFGGKTKNHKTELASGAIKAADAKQQQKL